MLKIKTRGDNMAVARLRKGLSCSQLAEIVGVTRQAIYYMEGKDIGVKPDRAKKICEVLEEEFDSLFIIGDGA